MLKYFYGVARETVIGFLKDDCFYRASSLTFYTLLSIVPILAVAFGIAKGFGFEKYLENEITQRLLGQPDLAQQIISFAYKALANTNGDLIATIGLLSLLWTSVQLFMNIERS